MPATTSHRRLSRAFAIGATSLLACFLSGSVLLLLADTPSVLRSVSVGGCYCKCSEAGAHPGCVKICDRPKYVARQKLVKCAKPRLHLPAENRDAGPRFPHPGRAERASAERASAERATTEPASAASETRP